MGRAISEENLWSLKQHHARLLLKRRRIAAELKASEELLNAFGVKLSNKCWSCKHTDSTTALTLCEIGNTEYPVACSDFNCGENK